jgi:beta-lactam-binding protein with PASTA domain/predicted Ser/Thr protein kinase
MTAQSRLLGGRYEVGELLGYGGMAEVHLGRDLRLGRDVAIKMLRTDLARDHTFQLRFRREAQNAAVLNHPGIAAVYDTGEEQAATGEALPYIVMEYVAGQTLKDILAAEGRLQPRRALEITADICAALEFSHRHGIIHRDVKPGNVMLTPNGQVKVMDFGIARDLASGATTMTQTSAVIGTAQYLSPEQARGEAVDARSDVYATGCVLFELLVGHPPFIGDSPVSVAYQHVREDPPAPSQLNPEVGPDIDAVVLKALSKNPINRYQSAAEMRADLLRAAAGRPVLATPVMNQETVLLGQQGEPARVGDPGRRRASTWVLASLAVLGVLAVIALIVGLILNNRDPAGAGEVTVPSLNELTPEEAEARLTEAGLQPERGDDVVEECAPEGRVADQDPDANTPVEQGSTVTYFICTGPALVTIPDNIVGSDVEAAQAQLEGLDLDVRTEPRDDQAPEGEVLEVNPPEGTEVEPGETVTLIYSAGNLLEVPDVVTDPRGEAIGALQQAGFQVDVQTSEEPPSELGQVDTVQAQNPAGGETAPRDSVVTIFVFGEGPDLSADLDQDNFDVTLSWDNGIFGEVAIDWGDGQTEQGGQQGEAGHTYDVTLAGQPITITISSIEGEGRTQSFDITLPEP